MIDDTILAKFFCQRISLYDYLRILEKTNQITPSVSKLSKRIVICVKHDGSIFPRKPTNSEVRSTTDEIIHQSIQCLMQRKTQNVLTQGFRFRSEFTSRTALKDLPYIVMATPNSCYNYFKTKTFENIHKVIGDDLFFYLLTVTSVFAALPKKCFLQLTGVPVSQINLSDCVENCNVRLLDGVTSASSDDCQNILKRKRSRVIGSREDKENPSAKKRRLEKFTEPLKFGGNAANKKFKKPKLRSEKAVRAGQNYGISSNVTYPRRSKIFYSKNFSEGFRKSYVINKVSISNYGVLELVRSIAGGVKENAKRTPKHLIPLCTLLKSIVAKFRKLRFRFLLNHHCPIPSWLKKNRKRKTTGSINVNEANNVFDGIRYKLAVQSYVPVHKVFLFLRSVLKKLFKCLFAGCPDNEKIFFTGLKRFIFLGRYEKLSVEKLTSTFKTTSFPWLPSSQNAKRRQIQQQLRDATILKQLVLWLYNNVVIPMITAHFYVTETGCHRNKVLYYRKPVWSLIQEIGYRSLLGNTFRELPSSQVKKLLTEKTCLGVYQLRFLPSISKIRPIANMSKCYSDIKQTNRVFINYILKPVQFCLRYEIERNPCLGATVADSNTVYNRLMSFLTHVRESHTSSPPLYVATLDISRCFDSLPQDKLLELISNVLTEPAYSMKKFSKIQVKQGNFISKRLVQYACDSLNCDTAFDYLKDKFRHKSLNCQNTIFIERPCATTYTRENVMSLLTKHLKYSIGCYGGKYLLQQTGIPQGSTLATLLSNFLLGHIERTDLRNILISPDTLLMRWIDDYFFVALSEEDAISFIKTLITSLSHYGYVINFDKSAANFETLSAGVRIRRVGSDHIAWCGYLINTNTLEFSFNYTQYVGESLRDSMTVEHSIQPAQSMCRKLLLAVSVKAIPLIVDVSCNSRDNQYLNIYQVFRYIALRFYAYFQVLSRDPVSRHRTSYYLNVIEKLHRKFYNCCTNNFRKSASTLTDENFVNSSDSFLLSLSTRTRAKIDSDLIQYLCYQAFIDCLHTKITNLGALVSALINRIKVLKRYDKLVDITFLRNESRVFKLIRTR